MCCVVVFVLFGVVLCYGVVLCLLFCCGYVNVMCCVLFGL